MPYHTIPYYSILNLGSLAIFLRFGFSRIHYVSCVADGGIEWPGGVAPSLVPLAQHEFPLPPAIQRAFHLALVCFLLLWFRGQINQEFFTNLLSSC